jgi:hypothetical protein
MARVIKIDNSLQKRFSKTNKKNKNKDLVAYFLIVCEGEKTEPNYFKGFPKKVGKIIYDIKFDGGGLSTLKVVEKAIELRNKSDQKYDRVWAVFDRDSFKSNSFNSAIKKAEAHGIECAWSNEAFELWYLLHFHNRITAMSRDQYKKAIESAINSVKNKGKLKPKSNEIFTYKKNDPDMYSIMRKYGNETQAIEWADALNKNSEGEKFSDFNPNTQVYKLVLELNGKSEKLNSEIIENHNNGK